MTAGTAAAVRRAHGQVYVDAGAMERLVAGIFEHAGCDAVESRRVAWRLTGANLRGHDSHGVLRARRYVEWMEDGKIFPGREIVKLDTSHEIFHIFFDIDEVAQVPGRMVTWDFGGYMNIDDPSYPPEVYAILDDDGRIMMLANYNTDLGDGWEHTFYAGYPTRFTNEAYKIGINFLIYAFSH